MRRAAVLVLAAIPAPLLAAPLATGAPAGVPWLRLIVSLFLCLAIALGAVLVLRNYQRRGTSPLRTFFDRAANPIKRRISVIETRRASVHGDLCLIECDGEQWLLALSPAGVTVLKGPEQAQ